MDKFEEAWKANRHVWESTKNLAKAMYLAGEATQQAKVEDANTKAQMCRDEKNYAINRWSAVCKERDELQKRVDKALQEIKGAACWIDEDASGDSDWLKGGALRALKRLEQALKGEV